ncbi:MAG: RimK family alpha-L-glutamate ligase [Promethearchaeota archaeon]
MVKVGITFVRVTYEIKKILTELEKRGIGVEKVDDRKIWFPCTRADFDRWGDVGLFLVRSLSASHGYYSALLLEHHGFRVINTAESLDLSGDKLKTTLLLEEAGIPTPRTAVAFTPGAALDGIEEYIKYPCVIKPVVGSWGRLISRLDDRNAAVGALEARDVLGSVHHKISYLQEFLPRQPGENPETFPRDLRVIVVGGEALGAMGRFEAETDFRSNVALGGRSEPFDLTPEVGELAVEAAAAVKAEMAGVDLMHGPSGWEVIEVNGTPQFRGFENSTGINVAGKMAEHVLGILKR